MHVIVLSGPSSPLEYLSVTCLASSCQLASCQFSLHLVTPWPLQVFDVGAGRLMQLMNMPGLFKGEGFLQVLQALLTTAPTVPTMRRTSFHTGWY